MHGGGSAPSCCAFTHRVAFEEGSGKCLLFLSAFRVFCGSVALKPPWSLLKCYAPRLGWPWGALCSAFSRVCIFVHLSDNGRTVAEAEIPILWPLMWRADSLEKTLMLGKFEGKRRRGWKRMRWLDTITDSMNMNLSKLWEIDEDTGARYAAVHGSQRARHNLANEQQQA